jgi:MYXO-CTERM domain-containing protein
MRHLIGASLIAAAVAVPMLVTCPANASLEACGNIHVEANAQCEAQVSGGCEANCTPIHFEAACAAEGYVSCKGKCTLPSVQCNASCEANCEGECGANPEFDCGVHCQGECDANCSGRCSAAGNKAECQAQCKATCKGECDASCKGSPVTCEGQCKGSCQGQCKVDTNFECQADCQSKLSASCYAEMEGGCKVACKKPEGALYCNGQYVDHGGNAQACLDAIAAWAARVDAYAEGSASFNCSGGQCTADAEGEAGCSMSVANATTDGSAPYALGLLGALGALVFSRVRRRK